MTAKPPASTRRTARVDGWPPRWLTKTSAADRRRGDGEFVCEFINAYARITKDTIAGPVGAPIVLRPWQRELVSALFARRPDGRRRHRTGLIGLPRKNGKSALGSGIGLYGLLAAGDGAEVYSCAADRDQARIVFGVAKRMVELDPELSEITKLYRDAIEVPGTGSIYRVLSSEAFTKEGLSPTLVLFDEVHAQPNRELWDVMNLGFGARIDPLLVGITTAGARTDTLGNDTLCYGLYQHGRRVVRGEVEDPTFFFAWWEPKKGASADHTDPKVWVESNPGLPSGLIDREDFAAVLPRTPEAEFRTKRTNVFTTSRESALPHGAWDRLAAPDRAVADGADVVLMFDGSYSGDSTGIVGATLEPEPHLFVVGIWENPDDGSEYRVPILDVEARIVEACRRWRVREVDCDPFRWQRSMDVLQGEGVPIVEYNTAQLARIIPAWQKFYDAVLDGAFSHDGDPRLARHVENMVLKRDQRGVRPVKQSVGRHIDLAVCAVGAHDRATVAQAPPLEPWAFRG